MRAVCRTTMKDRPDWDVKSMNEADALDIIRNAVWTVLVASSPGVLTAMIVGVVIALIQAVTQIQEQTLTFVPKIIAVMVALGISAPFVGGQISLFTNLVFSRVQSGF
jgi:flagellar biosynthetic protein FliQ